MPAPVFPLLTIAWIAIAGLAEAGGGLALVKDGQPAGCIVVEAGALKSIGQPEGRKGLASSGPGQAATELVTYLGKMTGLPWSVREDGAGEAPGVIFLGACEHNRAWLATKPLGPEEFVIRADATALQIAGGDRADEDLPVSGTLYGVYAFLEEQLGVRWLFPGEAGEVVPRRRELEIAPMDQRGGLPIAKRTIRNVAITREEVYAPWLEKWGVSVDAWKALGPQQAAWLVRQRIGSRIEASYGHSYEGFYAKYSAEHPDFFAVQPDGTRQQTPVRERLCVSNPALWDFVAQLRIDEFRQRPGKMMLSIAPNDGGANKFCMCEKCRALDPPEAPKLVNNPSLIDPQTGKPFPAYPSLTDRYCRFYNEVAKRVHAALPDRLLGCYAYSVYGLPPVAVQQLEPNLVVGYVGLDHQSIEAWSKVAAHLFIRPNDLGPAVEFGMPRNYAPYLAESVKFAVEHHAMGFDFDNCIGNWGTHGLDYYILAKALSDPKLDARAAIADYCVAAYGPGAEAMLRYYARLERVSDAVRRDDVRIAGRTDPLRLRLFYTPATLRELDTELAAARKAMAAAEAAQLTRLGMVEDGMKYAHVLMTFLEGAVDPGARKTPEYQQRLAAVIEFLKTRATTSTLASPHNYRYILSALGRKKREEE